LIHLIASSSDTHSLTVRDGNAEHFVDEAANSGISKWTLTGTTPEGRGIVVWCCAFYSFRDGKVIRKDWYWKIAE
jgi:ketosteroid isomerase-like protein